MAAYYNEIDPYAAQWLRNLIDAGLIADGVVDERSILDVEANDLAGFSQCHFFAGLGGWSRALRLAGWPDDRPVWTGSPPCQPFSTAGLRRGKDDERHLAPTWLDLVSQRKPPTIFGEQVEAAIRKGWLDDLQIHLETEGYAVGAVVLPACVVGAPQLRQRQWIAAKKLGSAERDGQHQPQGFTPEPISDGADWRLPVGGGSPALGLANGEGVTVRPGLCDPGPTEQRRDLAPNGRGTVGLGDPSTPGLPARERETLEGAGRREEGRTALQPGQAFCEFCGYRFNIEKLGRYGCANCESFGLADTVRAPGREDAGGSSENETADGRPGRYGSEQDGDHRPASHGEDDRPGPTNGFWLAADWLYCRDQKWRPVESRTFPLAHGIPARVGKLRAYGNAIVPQVAAEVIKAFMEYSEEK